VKSYSCDLHIHSALSPCAGLEMSPRDIVGRACEAGLDIIAITDHNMAENARYACEIGKRSNLLVLPGMELQTLEEIHLLAIFGRIEVALEFQEKVYRSLPAVENNADYFGDQVVVDEEDNIVRFEDRLLLNSAQISLDDAVALVKAYEGIVIPSHVDLPTFSIISQLGYIPQNLAFDALEIHDKANIPRVLPFVTNKNLPFVTFSDAHYLRDIGKRRTSLDLPEVCFAAVVKALRDLGEKAGNPDTRAGNG
jgi:3',5'-nucleoside bisphosphate phosphatase